MRINELEFKQRMLLYAVTSIGSFRIEMELENTTLDMHFIKIKAVPFTIDIPAQKADIGSIEMTKHAAEIIQLDIQTSSDMSIASAQSAAIAVININGIIADNDIQFDIISCNTKMLSLVSELSDIHTLINAIAVNVVNFAENIVAENILKNITAQSIKAKDTTLYTVLEQLLLNLNIDVITASTTDFSIDMLLNNIDSNANISIFAAALLELAIALIVDVDITVVNAKVDALELNIDIEQTADIIMSLLKVMTLNDYEGITLEQMSGNTLSELSIKSL